MSGRKWTAGELALLASLPPGEVARRTGRTYRAVCYARQYRGVARRCRRFGPARAARLLRGHAAGWPSARIAADLGCHRESVRRFLLGRGLRPNRDTPACRAWYAKQRRAALLRSGWDWLGQARYARDHLEVARAGWPAGATRGDAAAMAALRGGPLGPARLAAALGLKLGCGFRAVVARRVARCVANGWVRKAYRQGRHGPEVLLELAWRCRDHARRDDSAA